jgi:hypothetical protein
MEAFGVKANEVMLRAAVVMPIPSDLSSMAGAGAAAMSQGNTMAQKNRQLARKNERAVKERAAIMQDVTSDGAVLRPDGLWWPSLQGVEPPAGELDIQWPKRWKVVPWTGASAVGRAWRWPAGVRPGLLAGAYQRISFAGIAAHFLGPLPGRTLRQEVQNFWQVRAVPLGGNTPAHAWYELPSAYAPLTFSAVSASRRAPGGDRAALNALIWLPRQTRVAEEPQRLWLTESLSAALAVWMEKPRELPAALLRHHQDRYAQHLQHVGALDPPLGEAWAAPSGPWEAVVRDKGGMGWASVRATLGADKFLRFLRDWARQRQGGDGSWQDFLALMPPDADVWQSWSTQSGLPAPVFENVLQKEDKPGQWQVSGVLSQPQGPLGLQTDLTLVTADGVQRVPFRTFNIRTPFSFVSRSRPLRLVLDGAGKTPFVRREQLRVRDALSDARAVIVYGTRGDEALRAATQQAAEALAKKLQARDGVERVIYPDDAVPGEARQGPLILLGTPAVNRLVATLQDQFPVRFLPPLGAQPGGERLWWQGRTWAASNSGVVQVIANPQAPAHTVLLFAGLTPQAQQKALNYAERATTYCLFEPQGVHEGMALRPFPDLEYPLY